MNKTDNNPPIEAIVGCGESVELIVGALGAASTPEVQYEAAWCVTNIASGTGGETARLVAAGAVGALGALVAGTDRAALREQALWALGNVAGDGTAARDAVLGAPGLVAAVGAALGDATAPRTLVRTAAWTLLMLCRGDPAPPLRALRGILPLLGALLHSTDPEVIGDACAALLCVAAPPPPSSTPASAAGAAEDNPNARVGAVVELGVMRRVAELLHHPGAAVQQCALRLLGRVAAGADAHTQTVVNVGALPALRALLSSARRAVRRDACWALSNIAAGRREQVAALVAAGLLPPLLSAVRTDPAPDVRREAAYAVANACCAGAVALVQEVALAGALDALAGVLAEGAGAGGSDARLLAAVLDALEHIVRAGDYGVPGQVGDANVLLVRAEELGVVPRLEALALHHADAAVADAAEHLLRRFNDADDDEAADFFDDREGDGDDEAFKTLMDDAEDDEDDDGEDVITVPDMPSAGPAAVSSPPPAFQFTAQTPQKSSLFFQ